MADAQRRQLERASAQGGPQARARYLAGRVRSGQLPSGRLRLAAALGDSAAGAALGTPCEPELEAQFAALSEEAPAWRARVLVLGAEVVRPRFRSWLPAELPPFDQALNAARRWLDDPSEAHALAAAEAAQESDAWVAKVSYALVPRHRLAILSRPQVTCLEYFAWTARDAALAATACAGDPSARPELSSLVRLRDASEASGWFAPGVVEQALAAGLSAWALGGI